jgi:hypothetical protein
MTDSIADAEARRVAALDVAAEAAEQAQAWRERRNALIIQAAALNISYRRIAEYVGLSDVAVGNIARPHNAGAGANSLRASELSSHQGKQG